MQKTTMLMNIPARRKIKAPCRSNSVKAWCQVKSLSFFSVWTISDIWSKIRVKIKKKKNHHLFVFLCFHVHFSHPSVNKSSLNQPLYHLVHPELVWRVFWHTQPYPEWNKALPANMKAGLLQVVGVLSSYPVPISSVGVEQWSMEDRNSYLSADSLFIKA